MRRIYSALLRSRTNYFVVGRRALRPDDSLASSTIRGISGNFRPEGDEIVSLNEKLILLSLCCAPSRGIFKLRTNCLHGGAFVLCKFMQKYFSVTSFRVINLCVSFFFSRL